MQRNYLWVIVLVMAALVLGACATAAADPVSTPVVVEATKAPVEPTRAPEPTKAPEPTTAPEQTKVAEPTEAPKPAINEPLTVLCGVQEDLCQLVVTTFQKTSGIETSMVRMSSGEALARLQAEKDDPSFDVWYGGPSLGPGAAAQEGLIEPYVPENSRLIADALKDPKGIWTGIYIGPLGFCSNQKVLNELGAKPPTSWQDLLDPVFKSNIAVADQRTSGTAVTAGGALVALYDGEDGALEYMRKLDQNIFQYTKSGSSPGQMATAGEVAVAIIFADDCIKFGKETGVDLVRTFPQEGTGYEIGQVSLLAKAKHPEAAKVFIEWTLTPEAQELGATLNNFQIPTNPKAKVPPEAVRLEDVVLAKGFSPELVQELRAGDFAERFAAEVRDGQPAPE